MGCLGCRHFPDSPDYQCSRGCLCACRRSCRGEAHQRNVATAICYDASFPEHGRDAGLSGAHLYVCAGAHQSGNEHRRFLCHAARALDNTFYVGFVNLVGRCGAHTFSGGSTVYDPEGRVLVRASASEPEIVRYQLTASRLADVRREVKVLEHCRTPT
ncbi:MAG: hypothetical protein GEV10_26745 [Streptosporangiales bacterium]|nr:hypothetical protein [Streptosporangiales bacterium]